MYARACLAVAGTQKANQIFFATCTNFIQHQNIFILGFHYNLIQTSNREN